MIAKITKSYQFRDGLDYEEFVSGTRKDIMKYAKSKQEPDNEERYTIIHDDRGERDIVDLATNEKVGVDAGEDKLTFVSWVSEPSTDPDYPDEPDHYWDYALEVKFVKDVVEECKKEVIAL